MKEIRSVIIISLCFSIILFLSDALLNYRIFFQITGTERSGVSILLLPQIGLFIKIFIHLGSLVAGLPYALVFIKIYALVLLFFYACLGRLKFDERKPGWAYYLTAVLATILFLAVSMFSPFRNALMNGDSLMINIYVYLIVDLLLYGVIIYTYSGIGKVVGSWAEFNMRASIKNDPFGKMDRVFSQNEAKIENQYSVNIRYKFLGINLKEALGWINVINPFRGVLVLGTPGSGKSYAFFLPAIKQMIEKGYTMVLYDFKFDTLSKYAYNCLLASSKYLADKFGYVPQFVIVSLEQPLYSERCNVLQPHLLNDFTVDAYGLAKAFMVAINPSWKNKEGDFFPESATNLVAAAIWALKIHKGGKYCSLPHVIEFLSQDTKTIVNVLVGLKDSSLRNVVRPFEEAARDGAMEQLQGQMSTVRIALSRMSSPKLYFMLTEDPYVQPDEYFDLQVNSKQKPKILCLANSGTNQGVNNIVLSLFIVQIFRFINKKGQLPTSVMLDEAVTLSFPKGTLDTLIGTGRSHLISVWLGFQDQMQLVRDLGKEAAQSIINMIGNVVSGSVKNETAKMLQDLIGKVRILKRSQSVSADGDLSDSYQEQTDFAVPESYISNLSQGTFCGTLSDNFDQKMEMKAFYGAVDFTPPFKDDEMKPVPYSSYWQGIISRSCQGMSEKEIDEYVKKTLDINFERVVGDIESMKEEVLINESIV